ncbi:MAG: hypothetical protein H6623_07140 [Bdellovibrionaceae bacterium]|nr:hypothetical protein [Pseudobdellovibrionaceae bacterium]
MLIYLLHLIVLTSWANSQIHIQADGFTGLFRIDNSPYMTGDLVIDLTPGEHTIIFANNASVRFHIETNSVLRTDNPKAIAAFSNTLRFQTTAIEINPDKYLGTYAVYGGPLLTGRSTVRLLNHLENRIVTDIGGLITNLFVMDTELLASSENVIIDDHQVLFKTRRLQIDPDTYTANYLLNDWTPRSGIQTITIIENAHHRLRTGINGTIANFHVDDQGTIHTQPYGHNNLITGKDFIRFKTRSLRIDRGAYFGTYIISGKSFSANKNQFDFIIDATDRISTANNATITDIIVSADSVYVTNPEALKIKENSLKFLTQTLTISTSDKEIFFVDDMGPYSTKTTISLIKNVEFHLLTESTKTTFLFLGCDNVQQPQTNNEKFIFSCTHIEPEPSPFIVGENGGHNG